MVWPAVPMAKRGAFPATARRAERRLLLCARSVYRKTLTTLSAARSARRLCIIARPKRLCAGRWSLGRATVISRGCPPHSGPGKANVCRGPSRGRRAKAGALAWPARDRGRVDGEQLVVTSRGRQGDGRLRRLTLLVQSQRAEIRGSPYGPRWSASRAPLVCRRVAAVHERPLRPRGLEPAREEGRNIEIAWRTSRPVPRASSCSSSRRSTPDQSPHAHDHGQVGERLGHRSGQNQH
jgi:hypothetical protein